MCPVVGLSVLCVVWCRNGGGAEARHEEDSHHRLVHAAHTVHIPTGYG
jgi:hypothetical protein